MAEKRKPQDHPRVEASTRAQWRRWLEKNHEREQGAWLVFPKASSGRARVPYDDAVEEALCFGWIDSVMQPVDEHAYMQLFTPRRPRSAWSKLNKERVERLSAAGRMAPAGLAAVEAAKASGTWTALDAVESLEMPKDLAAALRKNAQARRNYESFSPSKKKAVLYRIASAKKPETRARRIEEAVELAALGMTPADADDKRRRERRAANEPKKR